MTGTGAGEPNRQKQAPAVPDQALAVARAAAREAAAAIVPLFRTGDLEVEHKHDNSPVTVADRRAEMIIRRHIGQAFPGHRIWGEEYGGEPSAQGWQWLIDPLDGTKSFVRGNPVFSIQIALWHDGRPMLAVSHVPVGGECAWAVRGRGAVIDGQPVQAGKTIDLARAAVSIGNVGRLAADARAWSGLAGIAGQAWRLRGYGDYLHYHLLARGGIDAVIESDVGILDIAALCLLVTEAGGVFTDLAGRPVGLQTTSVLAAATPDLHAELARRLGDIELSCPDPT